MTARITLSCRKKDGTDVYFALLHTVKDDNDQVRYIEPVSSVIVSGAAASGDFASVDQKAKFVATYNSIFVINGDFQLRWLGVQLQEHRSNGWFPYRDNEGVSDKYNGLLEIFDNDNNITYAKDLDASTKYTGTESKTITTNSYNEAFVTSVRQFERSRLIVKDIFQASEVLVKGVLEEKLKIDLKLLQNPGDSFIHRGQVTYTIPDEINVRNIRVDVLEDLRSKVSLDGNDIMNSSDHKFNDTNGEVSKDSDTNKLVPSSGKDNFMLVKYSVPMLLRYYRKV